MEGNVTKLILFFFLNVLSICSVNAITLTQTAGNILFDLSLVAPTDAGDYLNNSYTRDSTFLTIDNIPSNTKWRVYAKLSVYVHSGQQKIKVRIKRIGNGTGVNVPAGGNSFKTLDNTSYIQLFRGKGNRFNIPMRVQIKGIGVTDDYGTFDTIIEYKVETYL